MNKASLYTVGKKLQDNNLYFLSVYDLEPSGIIVHAYDQTNSKELMLPISEYELITAGISRSHASLSDFVNTIELVPQGDGLVLQSTNEKISKLQHRLTGAGLESMVKTARIGSSDQTMNDVLVTGLVELCKAKPVGLDAVRWLGEWLLENNPNKPVVQEEEDDE